MANPEHEAILEQGVEAWNQWREENPDIFPDLSGIERHTIDLTIEKQMGESDWAAINKGGKAEDEVVHRFQDEQQSIIGINLTDTILTGSKLYDVKLVMADLSRCELSDAKIMGSAIRFANLSYAKITNSHFNNVDLDYAVFMRADLTGTVFDNSSIKAVNFQDGILKRTTFTHVDITASDFSDAIMKHASITASFIGKATFKRANLSNSNLSGSHLIDSEFKRANLSNARLKFTSIVNCDFNEAQLIDCLVYGIAVWDINLDGATQSAFVITPPNEPPITVDNLELAQFIYLLLHNDKLRDIIDTITSTVVLILGRFTPERKAILDAIREELRKHNYSPVLFDFEKPAGRDLTETISLLARMSRFIIADLTSPKSLPNELAEVIPTYPSVPVQPIIKGRSRPYAMYERFKHYPWVLGLYRYRDLESLLATFTEQVILPAERKVSEMRGQR